MFFGDGETDLIYRPSFYAEKLEAVKKDFVETILPDSIKTAKNLFWGNLNFECSQKAKSRLVCENAWSGQEAIYYWNFRWHMAEASSTRKWNLFFADEDLHADGTVKSCSTSSYFRYITGIRKGAYDECGKVTWNSGGECRKISANPAFYEKSGSICGVSPRRVYLDAAKDLWQNFTAPTLLMLGEIDSLEQKNVTSDGKHCLHWDSSPLVITANMTANITGLKSNFCSNLDDWVYGDWCFVANETTGEATRRECYDTTLPMEIFPEGCLSPNRKYGYSYEWCITGKNQNYPYGGSWKSF